MPQSTNSHRSVAEISLQPVKLTKREEQVLSFLQKVVDFHGVSATLRVAGGWVRNKLLGLQSDDIDIAVDVISGEKLASLIVAYQRAKGVRESMFGVINRNPAQSKHLETVTIRLFGLDIDINQLRTENYACDSRIPEVREDCSLLAAQLILRDFFFLLACCVIIIR